MVEIPLKWKYRRQQVHGRFRSSPNGHSGQARHKGVLIPVGLRKVPKLRPARVSRKRRRR